MEDPSNSSKETYLYLWTPEHPKTDFKRLETFWVKTLLHNDDVYTSHARALIKSSTVSFERMADHLRKHDELLEKFHFSMGWDVQTEVCDRFRRSR